DIQGMVTLEDLLEEIVGDFTTSITGQTQEHIHRQADGTYLVEGTMNLRDLNKELKVNLPIDGPKTLNGLIIEEFGDIPQYPMCIRIAGYVIEILEVTDNRVEQVRIQPKRKRKSR
ncbi:MAG: magnesium/cobalt efflux protein, partial [Gammaproteobacteria bacterium]|nr:magnesium/cobalt efflux protein [Gammaproteobacteria bacterium]